MSKSNKETKQTVTKQTDKKEKTAKKTKADIMHTASGAVKNALNSLSAKIDNAIITAYKAVNQSTIDECMTLYKGFTKAIIIPAYNMIEVGKLSQPDFEKEINALKKHTLRNYATALLLCIQFSLKFDAVSSTTLQALFNEIAKYPISKIKKFSESMFHFGLHGCCKYKTGETGANKDGKIYDKVALNLFDTYPLAVKSAKVFTNIEAGKYYPIPNNAMLYCTIANSLNAQKIKYVMKVFIDKCISEKEREQITA